MFKWIAQNKHYKRQLRALGFSVTAEFTAVEDGLRSFEALGFLARHFIHPTPAISQIVQKHSADWKGKLTIGLQVRMGGSATNWNDRIFLEKQDLETFWDCAVGIFKVFHHCY
jgi:hypothetical protein